MNMIRTRDWKLVHFFDKDFGQLFDLAADPGEVENLWDAPAAQQHKFKLLDRLCEWHIRRQCAPRNGRHWR